MKKPRDISGFELSKQLNEHELAEHIEIAKIIEKKEAVNYFI
jgi:hypothetical protein